MGNRKKTIKEIIIPAPNIRSIGVMMAEAARAIREKNNITDT